MSAAADNLILNYIENEAPDLLEKIDNISGLLCHARS